jgi:hypothetical protein
MTESNVSSKGLSDSISASGEDALLGLVFAAVSVFIAGVTLAMFL